jgi:predicted small lipoprotein YifL
MRHYLTFAALLAAISLGGCGTKGPLTLPVKPVPSNTPAAVTPPQSPAATANDLNTAKEPAR